MMNYTERNNSMKKRKITKITLAALLAAAVHSHQMTAEVNRKTRAAVKQKMKAAAKIILKTKLQMQQILFQIQKN